jgi:hypothetical protein
LGQGEGAQGAGQNEDSDSFGHSAQYQNPSKGKRQGFLAGIEAAPAGQIRWFCDKTETSSPAPCAAVDVVAKCVVQDVHYQRIMDQLKEIEKNVE